MTKILLCVGEPILARGIESLLQRVDNFELLPTCCGVTALMESLARGASPDVVLLDLTPEVTFEVMSDLKYGARSAKVVLWAKAISPELAFQALGLGIRGVLRKQLPPELQVRCLEKVHAGELWFEKALTDSFLSSRRVTLTRRESQLVGLLTQGMKNKEIAQAMNLSDGSVKIYLSRLFEKTGVKDRFELALFGLKNMAPQPSEESQTGQPGKPSSPAVRSLIFVGQALSPANPT